MARKNLSRFFRHFCPICNGDRLIYEFVSKGYPVCECSDCGLMFFNPQPSDQALKEIYSCDYFLGSKSEEDNANIQAMKKATVDLYLQQLVNYKGHSKGRLLEIGCGEGHFLAAAKEYGFTVTGNDISPHACQISNQKLGGRRVQCGSFEKIKFPDKYFDVCVMFDVIEHSRDPIALLKNVKKSLKPDGVLFFSTPSLDNWSARLLKQNWLEFKAEHLFYFNKQTSRNLLIKSGFENIQITPTYKYLTLDYINHHFSRFKVPFFSSLLALLTRISPRFLKTLKVKTVASGINVLCRSVETKEEEKLSVIIPVFNEIKTFENLMELLLKKKISGIKREIIVVESGSTDGTREAVLKYKNRQGVKVVLEESPKGKGHAVRTGLAQASGGIVIIQDGDLEYDLNDYEQLLEPILRHQQSFVLGSRHSKSWKIREFTHEPAKAFSLNLGHLIFTFLLNIFCGSKLKDPFTMFKVFRKDCIYGLTFKANRFDFDFELMIKLLRKGYQPLEIPVNYRSRSFREGKKVKMLWDPLTWLWAILRFRFCGLYEGGAEN